jgi:hypothetical protein
MGSVMNWIKVLIAMVINLTSLILIYNLEVLLQEQAVRIQAAMPVQISCIKKWALLEKCLERAVILNLVTDLSLITPT